MQLELDVYTGTENVHDLPAIANYWFDKFIVPMLVPFGFRNSVEFFRTYIGRICRSKGDSIVSILSIGAGGAATEINVAEWLRENGIENYSMDCVDINAAVLKRGEESAAAKGFGDKFRFKTFDVNSWNPEQSYDVVLAIQSLHHFVELELLFEKIHAVLRPDGYFLTDDMIGRNGHRRWPEALKHVRKYWRELPEKYRYNHGEKRIEKRFPNTDYSMTGFEGIRAQDILPLLTRRFYFELFFGFANVVDIFLDRAYGYNFDPANESDRTFIDKVHALDQSEIESGRIKPTHMFAAMTKLAVSEPRFYKHLSVEFCTRRPGLHYFR